MKTRFAMEIHKNFSLEIIFLLLKNSLRNPLIVSTYNNANHVKQNMTKTFLHTGGRGLEFVT